MQEIVGNNFDAKNYAVAFVFFLSNTCGPCKLMLPLLSRIIEIFPSVSFHKADVDENAQLKTDLAIENLPTILIFINGNEVQRLNGLQGEKKLKEIIQSILN